MSNHDNILWIVAFICFATLFIYLTSSPMEKPKIERHIERDSFHEAMANVQKAKENENQRHHHSREHTVIDLTATFTDADGKETTLDITKDGVLEQSGNSAESQSAYTKKQIVIANCVTAVITGAIGAALTLAIKYGDCKKD